VLTLASVCPTVTALLKSTSTDSTIPEISVPMLTCVTGFSSPVAVTDTVSAPFCTRSVL
jgi:hypothetical protein